MTYTKEFLVNCYLSRFRSLDKPKVDFLANQANKFYDEVGKDKFRVYASLDADAIKKARNVLSPSL